MVDHLELPDDLSEDMEVLFVNHYSPEEALEIRSLGASDERITEIFKRANKRDPGLKNWEDIMGFIKAENKLGGYIVGADLIILYGERDRLENAKRQITENNYNCFFETIGNFMAFSKKDDAKVTVRASKPAVQ
jgi:hypothetical protein